MKRHALLMVVVAFALLAVAPVAYGAGAVTDGYGGKGGGVLGAVNSGGGNGSPPAQVAEASSGSLPFTGLDIGLLALGGGVLVAVGFGLRRLARPLS